MSDYWASARSNYFKVKNLDVFRREIDALNQRLGAEAVQLVEEDDGTVCLLDASEQGWSSAVEGLPDPFDDIVEFVVPHLADDWVAIFMEIGGAKLQHIGGYAVATNSAGATIEINLHEIHEQAAQLGGQVTRVFG